MTSILLKRFPSAIRLPLRRSLYLSPSRQDVYKIQDSEDFEARVLNVKGKPVIIDFYANWCGPCKVLLPRLERVIIPRGDAVHLAQVDIDELTDVALDHGVSAVPHVVAYRDGKILDRFVGLQDEDQVEVFVERAIEGLEMKAHK